MASPTAVFLMNLGGPQSQQEVRSYLYQLFKDPEILRLPAVVRLPLAWTIATLRAPSSRAKYALLGGGSPLVANTRLQSAALAQVLGPGFTCHPAMRCGHPSTKEAVADALRAGATRAVALPLYPQFAGATTRSSLDELDRRWPRELPLARVRSYATDPLYIEAMAATVREALAQLPAGSKRWVVFSAHGIPMRDVRAGDPYEQEARATAAALVKSCALGEGEWQLTYQSRVRPREWLGPDTVQAITGGARGRGLVLVPLTFVSEHLETLYDLDILARRAAEAAGATAIVRARALGDRPEFIAALAAQVRQAPFEGEKRVKIAVVGGGVAGLAAALELADGGAEVALFEAAARPGGKVGSVREQGFVTEDGPNALTGSDPAPRTLVVPGALEGQEVFAPRHAARFVWRRGRLLRASPRNLFSLASPLGIGRALLEPLLARRAVEEESLAAFCRRHLGGEVGGLVARLMAAGVYASEAERLSAAEAFPTLVSLERQHRSLMLGARKGRRGAAGPAPGLWSVRGGLGSLATAAAARLGPRLRLEAPVMQLAPRGPGWDLAFGGPAAGSDHYDGIVLALPPSAALRLALGFSPPLARALEVFKTTPVAVVHLGVRASDLATPAEGFGLLDGDGSLALLGVLFSSALFPDRAPAGHSLLTVLVGGSAHPERVSLAEGALVDLARGELGKVLGLRGLPVYSRVLRHAEAIPRYELGHAAQVSAAEAACRSLPPLVLAGAAYHGVSVGRSVQGGRDAARTLVARLESAS